MKVIVELGGFGGVQRRGAGMGGWQDLKRLGFYHDKNILYPLSLVDGASVGLYLL
jgi:hypothetical protein